MEQCNEKCQDTWWWVWRLLWDLRRSRWSRWSRWRWRLHGCRQWRFLLRRRLHHLLPMILLQILILFLRLHLPRPSSIIGIVFEVLQGACHKQLGGLTNILRLLLMLSSKPSVCDGPASWSCCFLHGCDGTASCDPWINPSIKTDHPYI